MHAGTRFTARLLGVAAAGIVAAACAASVTPSPPPPDPPDPTPTSPLSSGTVKLPVYPPPVVPDVPPLGGPPPRGKPAAPLTSPKAKATLASIAPYCAPAVTTKGGEEIVGCACCPPFSLCAPTKEVELTEADQVYQLEARYDGAFTGPNATDAALVFEGCDANARSDGGALLVERPDPKDPDYADPFDPKTKLRQPDWRFGVHPSKCSTLKDNRGIDRLVCTQAEARDGTSSDALYAYDFTKRDEDARGSLFVARDNTVSGCRAGATATPIIAQKIGGHEEKDTNGDGMTDVVVTVQARKGTSVGAFAAACVKADATPPGPPPASALTQEKTVKLTYLQKKDGTFEPTAETKTSLEWMNGEYDKARFR